MINNYFSSLKRPIAMIGAAATLFFLIACGGDGDDNGDDQNPTSLPQGLYDQYPIDGVVVWSEFIAVMRATVDIRDNWGSGALVNTSDVQWAWVNDDQYLYLAVEWTDDIYNHGYNSAGPVDFDGVQVIFDNDGDGTNEAGEDKRTIIAASVGSQYIDGFYNPDMPTNLAGLIVFTSDHETANNEIYSFDPATKTISKITDLPGLFKDNPSLSHDRTRVAFHGAHNVTDYANYEIYIISVNGSGFAQLTSNSILDGHPGWHPDNSTIAYASFRDGGQASIVLMDDTGIELADLTPSGMGYDDNDPDFLPDGRIVFKTNRFSTAPQVRIAVMDSDGANLVQLTDLSGVSDHDPVGDTTHTVFERFNKGTDYVTDLEAPFTPWDIVEVRLDGTNETVLLTDAWVNWLPIYGPNGHYILYLKSAGYVAAHLMTLDGEELGRLIPGMTRRKYIDWK